MMMELAEPSGARHSCDPNFNLNVLIVSSCFFPEAVIGAKRPTGVAIKLRALGVSTHVVTIAQGCVKKADMSADATVLQDMRITYVPCRSLWRHSRIKDNGTSAVYGWLKTVQRGIAKLTEPLLPLDEMYPWACFALSSAVRVVENEHIDVIWATAPPASNLMLAHRISQQTGVPFVVDYRDVPDPQDNSRRHRRRRVIEQTILHDCAGITYVSPRQREALLESFPGVASKPCRLIYNFYGGYPKCAITPFSLPANSIVYGGGFYSGERRLRPILDAIQLAHYDDSRPHLYLFSDDFGEYTREELSIDCKKRGIERSVHTERTVSQTEFDAYCNGAAIQLLLVGHGRKHTDTIPAKLYDYLANRRPILVVGPRDTLAGEIVERVNGGLAVWDDDPNEIFAAMRHLFAGVGGGGRRLDMSPEAVQRFASERVVGELLAFLREACAKANGANHRNLAGSVQSD